VSLGLLSDCCRGLELNRKLHSWKKQLPKRILLEGATDPPQRKLTNNSHDLKGSTSQSDVELGVFCCAIGGLPLFASLDLVPTIPASSGWLSFSRPVANDHIVLVEPNSNSVDQRIDVLYVKITCHLGHYFDKGEGYCTNASALDFVAVAAVDDSSVNANVAAPISWRTMEAYKTKSSSVQLVQKFFFFLYLRRRWCLMPVASGSSKLPFVTSLVLYPPRLDMLVVLQPRPPIEMYAK